MNKLLISAIALAAITAQAQQPTTTTTTTTAPVVSTSPTQTSMTEIKPEAKKWSAAYTLDATSNMKAMNEEGTRTEISTLNVITLGYKLNDKYKVSVNPYFTYTKAASGAEQKKAEAGDTYVNLSTSYDGILGSEKISTTYRYYIPHSEASVDAKSMGSLRVIAGIPWNVTTKFTLSYNLDPRIIFNRVNHTGASLLHYGVAEYSFNDNLSVYQAAGMAHSAASLPQMTLTKHRNYFETGLNIAIGKTAYVNVNMNTLYAVYDKSGAPVESTALYRPEQTDYEVVGQILF